MWQASMSFHALVKQLPSASCLFLPVCMPSHAQVSECSAKPMQHAYAQKLRADTDVSPPLDPSLKYSPAM